ncbi:hypothetical protein HO345_01445 [Treponema denticola]|uniref:hypothetical protein n=1 Tax=Treponema denticola TaxID=158 RepID=UPI0020A60B82|nr:hypothetical protein [Treponema denticola]UTD11736.1 hypothetical protein HO345_01445 [Treponema denticola]
MLATVKGYYKGTRIVLDSPVQLRQGQEVIVTYTVAQSAPIKEFQLDIVESLIGAIPDAGKSLAEYREERLKKYASAD